MNTAINSHRKAALLALPLLISGLLFSTLLQANTLECGPQDLQSPYSHSPTFSVQGPLLRMQYQTPGQETRFRPVSDSLESPTLSDGHQPGADSDSALRLWRSNPACPPEQEPPQRQSAELPQAPVRVWL
ncbi:hypothetical protein [Marinobacterium rhizophilum]|uniref:hypothetical protein n=1 Tax=Marinobacterium rhizophilum TaxID=420402 RepID=UPI000361F040|nr:hypothetical protein [Marinobacterium rhizophilum]